MKTPHPQTVPCCPFPRGGVISPEMALLATLIVSHLMFAPLDQAAPNMAIDSLSGPVTTNEITSFKNYMATQTPPPTPWGALNGTTYNLWCDAYGGVDLEAFGQMYEASGDITILTNMIHWTDICVSERNDLMAATNGGQRICWDGIIDHIWVAQNLSVTNPSTGCETGDTAGHIAYCAQLILKNPSIWNTTVPDGNPF